MVILANALENLCKFSYSYLVFQAFQSMLLDLADTTCESLSPLLAVATGEGALDNETKRNRDRAYAYLKAAVDETREYGRYVFWRNQIRLRGYASEYVRRHRSPRGNSAAPQAPAGTASAG